MVIATGLVALLVSVAALNPKAGRIREVLASPAVLATIVHEAGHALASVVTGNGVYLIEIHTPHSGRTHFSWYSTRPASIITSVAGYAAPPLAGLGAASLLARGHAPMVLALTVVMMALILVVARDVVTLVSVLTVGAVAFAAVYWGPLWVQHGLAYALVWLLLLAEAPGVWVLVCNRFYGHPADDDDAASLADLTGVPSLLWILGWFALIGWSIWTAVPFLWP